MNTKKSLNEQMSEILNSTLSRKAKVDAIIKLGVTPYEALFLAQSSIPATPRSPRVRFAYTFGVEMETYNCDARDFLNAATQNGIEAIDHTGRYSGCHIDIPQFKLVPDGSLSGYKSAECVTPALDGNTKGFDALKACCAALNQVGAKVNKSCGLHVHIGARSLSDRDYCNVFVNYMMLETAIESFMAPSRRGANARWCYSLRNHEQRILAATTKSEIRQALQYDRYHRVNAEAYDRHETIEFRQHQGTINYTKVSHWVKFLAKLVEFSKKNRLNANIDRIEDIPFLTKTEKTYFCRRRADIEARNAQ